MCVYKENEPSVDCGFKWIFLIIYFYIKLRSWSWKISYPEIILLLWPDIKWNYHHITFISFVSNFSHVIYTLINEESLKHPEIKKNQNDRTGNSRSLNVISLLTQSDFLYIRRLFNSVQVKNISFSYIISLIWWHWKIVDSILFYTMLLSNNIIL